jgi:hypothetical protein
MANLYSFEIGITLGGMVNVETLDGGKMPAPRATYKPYSELIHLGNGAVRGVGYPVIIWKWGILSRSARDALRVYCPSSSSLVYIKTQVIDSSDTYVTYQAWMIWPEEEDRDASRRVEFAVEFRKPVAA